MNDMMDKASYAPAVLRYREGGTEQCLADPAVSHDLQQVRIVRPGGEQSDVPFSLLKAIFFLPAAPVVSDVSGGEEEGITLTVEFSDGEKIRGTSTEYNPARSGFFMYPADRSRNDRIFVVTSAIVSIDVEKL